VSRFASLPMYDLPELHAATDRLWERLAHHLERAGVSDVPECLDRETPYGQIGRTPALLFTQTCGYPLTHADRRHLRVIAAPRYSVPGCEGSMYRSVIVVQADSRAETLADLRGAACAVNGFDSHSGANVLAFEASKVATADERHEPFFGRVVVTGGHEESVAAVAEGACALASIDAVTYALLAAWRPRALAGTRFLAWTEAAPAPPFVTRQAESDAVCDAIGEALEALMRDPEAREARHAVRLEGVERIPASAYSRIEAMEGYWRSRTNAIGSGPVERNFVHGRLGPPGSE
jgi:ABC-type phosphate/phosphonate transport system substrate-binding protein